MRLNILTSQHARNSQALELGLLASPLRALASRESRSAVLPIGRCLGRAPFRRPFRTAHGCAPFGASILAISRVLVIFCLLVPSQAFAADKDDFIVYEAQSRSAEELRTAASSISQARVSVLNNKVIIYGTRSQRDAVLKLFGELDHPLRNFVVRVRNASRGSGQRDAGAVEANAGAQGVSIRKKSGVLIGNGGRVEANGVSVSEESSEAAGDAGGDSEVTVLDGGSGTLYSGGVFPKTVTVKVRAIGKSGAHVEIREADSNVVGEQAIVTEVNVPLGEWRSVGGITQRDSGRNTEILGRAKRSSMSSRDVQVRVDPASSDNR
jgi:hypothetical protein